MVNWHSPKQPSTTEEATMEKHYTKKLGNVIEINNAEIQDHLGELVRGTVEETLNSMLDAEADNLCNAARYERTEARRDTRAGHYNRNLQTKAGEVNLLVPKLRQQKSETFQYSLQLAYLKVDTGKYSELQKERKRIKPVGPGF